MSEKVEVVFDEEYFKDVLGERTLLIRSYPAEIVGDIPTDIDDLMDDMLKISPQDSIRIVMIHTHRKKEE